MGKTWTMTLLKEAFNPLEDMPNILACSGALQQLKVSRVVLNMIKNVQASSCSRLNKIK
jgi:hypothetical protein